MNKYPYKMTFEVSAIAPGVTIDTVITNDKGVSFVAEEVSAIGFETLDGIKKSDEAMCMVAVNFKNALSDGYSFDKAIPLHLVAGTGENPHILSMPIEFKGQSPIMSSTNFSTDKTYAKVFVTLHGYRLTDDVQ